MQISLIRHGKSLCDSSNPVTYSSFKIWIKDYNNLGVFEEEKYPSESIEIISTADLIYTSELRRSIHSAYILNKEIKVVTNSLFGEVELPSPLLVPKTIKLKPKTWLIVLRVLWLLGASRNCESLKSAKIRANKAAEKLIQSAKNDQKVVLVGHGIFNRLISKELEKRGWLSDRKISSNHWICTTYSLN